MTYNSLQIKFQKNYSHGLSLLGGYNYHLEKDEEFFDDIASYNRNYTWQNTHTNRHRITAAGTWNIPFGKGRAYMTKSPRVLDAVLGGWKISSVLFWRSGQLLDFGSMVWNGKDPRVSNPTPERWFDTSVFQRQPDYTPRTSPWDYPGLMGPGQFNMDASLVKEFRITERLRMELKADAFNVINNMSWGNPDTSFDSSNFGQSTNPLDYTFGRRMQLGVRLEF